VTAHLGETSGRHELRLAEGMHPVSLFFALFFDPTKALKRRGLEA
jgi:hypothetical protein